MSITKKYANSNTLVIATTGLANKLNLPVDDFFKAAGLCTFSRIVLKDPSKRLMLAGLPAEYPSFFDIVNHLKDEIAHLSPERIIVTGTSGGGHTALLMGHLLKADYVVAFNPYTYLSPEDAQNMEDEPLKMIHKKRVLGENISAEVKQLVNLRTVLSNYNNKTKYYLHVSRYQKWDYKRAKYLKEVRGLSIISHPYTIHSLAQPLAREDKLKECFALPYKRKLRFKDVYRFTKRTIREIIPKV